MGIFRKSVSVAEAFGVFGEWVETRGGFAQRTRVEYRECDMKPRQVSETP